MQADSHTRRAYHRDLEMSIESALRVARIDQRSRTPASIGRCDWLEHPTDYIGAVCGLLNNATFARFTAVERQAAANGQPVERKLTDFSGGATTDD